MTKQFAQKRSIWLLSPLLAALLVLPGCVRTPAPAPEAVALPTHSVSFVAPIGDAALEYTGSATLYMPRFGTARLLSITDTVAFSAARLNAESITRALLAHAGNGVAAPLGGEVKLSLFGANPVEVSGGVATVNLSASALQLDRATLYLCGQAFANTLTELPGIRYVNLLVMDKQIGLDLGSTLPTGALTRSLTGDTYAPYEQALTQRAQAGEDPAAKRLTATVTLYLPQASAVGVMSEARNITFASQRPQDMALRLVEELAKGPAGATSPALPLLADLLLAPPDVTDGDGGSRIVTLRFDSALYDMLDTAGVARASCYASLTYTLCTFLPNITGIMVYVGDERVDHVMLGATEGILFDGGVQRRAHYAQQLLDEATLYLADADGEHLVPVRRPVAFHQVHNPRGLMLMLLRGTVPEDRPPAAQPLLPASTLSDADILGISLIDRVLVVNLSDSFRAAGAGLAAQQERLLVYGLVNTLLCGDRATNVCFFVGGRPFEGFSGNIDWAGLFYESRGLAIQPE
jgi:hypothetical protein